MNSPSEHFVARFQAAIASHDADEVAECFAQDCRFDLPVYPSRGFTGRSQARQNWETVFAAVPDLAVSLLRVTHEGNSCWAEWEYVGTRVTGEAHLLRGVTIVDVTEDGLLQSSRFYVDQVDDGTTSISAHLDSLTAPGRP
jgi:ketosteroid isomerase-like protein